MVTTMRRLPVTLVFFLLFAFLVAACSEATREEEVSPPAVEGPALVMFYTDN